MTTRRVTTSSSLPYALLFLFFLGLLLRSLRLNWQPLWWDEGYSVYFATEPFLTMLRLTAQDIHPPLYYGLLRGWLLLWGDASPLALRTFSLVVGGLTIPAFWWLARSLFPAGHGVVLLATLLLVLNPMHIFYSQEIRMYGLEMLLGILSTGFFWRMMSGAALARRQSSAEEVTEKIHVAHAERHVTPAVLQLGYFFSTTALLYTEYYAVLLPLAHFLWASWRCRRHWSLLHRLIVVDLAIALVYLPWLLYAVPELILYIPHKVLSDADQPLGAWVYLWRHLLAFSAGHVSAAAEWLRWLQLAGVVAVMAVGIGYWILGIADWRLGTRREKFSPEILAQNRGYGKSTVHRFLLFTILLPFFVGFLLNLRLPFFPDGGERVLLFVLPYFLLLLAAAVDQLWRLRNRWSVAGTALAVAGLLLAAQAGIVAFYTVPRYVESDYRPLIRQTIQQGGDEDTVFAIFPWQMGYWRAYAPLWGRGEHHGPWPIFSPSPAWSDEVAAALDAALGRGKIWFPAHLSMGGILEGQVESYLAQRSLNFDQRWYNSETRLSGWIDLAAPEPPLAENGVDFGPLRLQRAAVGPLRLSSANQVLAVELDWLVEEPQALPLAVSLRLLDENQRIWANRDYTMGDGSHFNAGKDQLVGLLVPSGVPPGEYQVAVGVGPVVEEPWLFPIETETGATELALLASIQVAPPERALPPLRLPIQQPLATAVEREGVEFLGFSGYDPDLPSLAGTELGISLFIRNRQNSSSARHLFVSLLDSNGVGVAGWEGWPLPSYTPDTWSAGALVRIPINFYLPAALPPGNYKLITGWLDPVNGEKSVPVELGTLPVMQRAIRLDMPAPQTVLEPSVQVGTHARLLGYDLGRAENTLELTLYWQVLQTLLPPHHVFVHLSGPEGTILAQDDGMPGRRAVAAPSGTWLPGEVIVDPHRLVLPSVLPEGTGIQVGLYRPETGVRLQVFVDGRAQGDSVSVPLQLE